MTNHRKFIVTYDPPPIPGWEKICWQAVTDDYDLDDPIGFGATPAAALDDLIEQLEEKGGE